MMSFSKHKEQLSYWFEISTAILCIILILIPNVISEKYLSVLRVVDFISILSFVLCCLFVHTIKHFVLCTLDLEISKLRMEISCLIIMIAYFFELYQFNNVWESGTVLLIVWFVFITMEVFGSKIVVERVGYTILNFVVLCILLYCANPIESLTFRSIWIGIFGMLLCVFFSDKVWNYMRKKLAKNKIVKWLSLDDE